MTSTTGQIEFPGAVVYVSYGQPTEFDKVGCDGMYVEKVEIKNIILFLIYNLLTKLRGLL
jgi:hypothetical protein